MIARYRLAKPLFPRGRASFQKSRTQFQIDRFGSLNEDSRKSTPDTCLFQPKHKQQVIQSSVITNHSPCSLRGDTS